MTKEQVLRKLTSRKFWISVCSFITALLVAFNVQDSEIAQVTSIIMAFGSLMIYVISESATDVASLSSNTTDTTVITNIKGSEDDTPDPEVIG